MERAGLSGPDADTGAEVLSTTDAWGVFTHGSKALRGYLRRLRAGGLRARGRPAIAAEGPAWAVVDGDSALGMVTSVVANDIPSVAAPGSRTAVTGSNPLAYAVPAGQHPPLMLDMSNGWRVT